MLLIRRLLLASVLLFIVAVGLVPAIPAHADPERIFLRISRVMTLRERSVDGPALWTRAIASFTPNESTAAAILAWTGMDHRVNLLTSQDGLSYSDKETLPYYAETAPAVMVYQFDGIDHVLLAWVGPEERIHLLFDALGARHLVTLAQFSDAAPTMTQDWHGNLWLAWRGTDVNHRLNLVRVTLQTATSVRVGSAATLSHFSALGRPSLVADMTHYRLVLAWTDTGASDYLPAARHYLNLLTSSDLRVFRVVFDPPPAQFSGTGPSLVINNRSGETGENVLCWRGTDTAHSINLALSSNLTSWDFGISTVIHEQARGTPACGHVATLGSTNYLVAWTGINAGHNLNVALIDP